MIIGFTGVAVLAVLLLVPLSAQATIYQCLDASGAKVLTDTPAQLKSCTPLSTGSAGSPSLSPTPAGPPVTPPTSAGPRSPSAVSTAPPPEPTESEPPPGADDELPPSGQAPPNLPTCKPGLDPLNPLGSVKCAPPGPPAASSP